MSTKTSKMELTIFSVMSALAQKHNAINLAQGFPGFSCAEDLINSAHKFMLSGANQYAPMPGVLPLREALSTKILEDYGYKYDVDSEICITAGATESVHVGIQALVEPGDEVIILEPAFDMYGHAVLLAGGKPVYVNLNLPDFSINWEHVRVAISSKTKLLIINSPHNPTGSIIKKEDLDTLAVLADQHDFYVMSDEVYEHIVFDGQDHHSAISNELLRNRSLVIFSLGKTFNVTGWRVGACVACEFLMNKFKNIHQYVTFCSPTPFQLAIAEQLQIKENYKNLNQFFQYKRDLFLKAMKDGPFTPLKSSGTYFQMMSYQGEVSDYDLVHTLVRKNGVAAIPLSSFYHDKTDHHILRFCFAKEDQDLIKAAQKLTEKSW